MINRLSTPNTKFNNNISAPIKKITPLKKDEISFSGHISTAKKVLSKYEILQPKHIEFFTNFIKENKKVKLKDTTKYLDVILKHNRLEDHNVTNLLEHMLDKKSLGLKRDINVLDKHLEHFSSYEELNSVAIADCSKFLLENPDLDAKTFRKGLEGLLDNEKIPNYHKVRLAKFVAKNPETTPSVINFAEKGANISQIDFLTKLEPEFSNKLQNAKSLHEFDIKEKKVLFKNLLDLNFTTLNPTFKKLAPIMPENKKEYNSLLGKLTINQGLEAKLLSKTEQKKFNKAVENIGKFFEKDSLNDSIQIKLKFPKEDFIKEVNSLTKKLNTQEKRKATSAFGFEINDNKIEGYPIIPKDYSAKNNLDKNLKNLVEKISYKNEILVPEKPELAKILNNIAESCPQFTTLIEKKQHKTHHFNLDVHSLKVTENIIKSKEWNSLSNSDKKVMVISSLFHDITKAEGTIDKTHPRNSAFDSFLITSNLDITEKESKKIHKIIKNHDWLEKVSKAKNKKNAIKSQAFNLMDDNLFSLSRLFCEADLKSIQKNNGFLKRYGKDLKKHSRLMKREIKNLKSNSIIVPQTKMTDFQTVIKQDNNGIKNKVIYLSPSSNNEKDFFAFAHSFFDISLGEKLGTKSNTSKLDELSSLSAEPVYSCSYINKNNYKTFRQQSFIIEVEDNDILMGYHRDLASGENKSLNTFKENYLHDKKTSKKLRQLPKQIRKLLKIGKKKYQNFIEDFKSSSPQNQNKPATDKLKSFLSNMEIGKRADGRKYNEFLVTNPKIKALYFHSQSYNQIQKEYKQYAMKNDLPIIILNKSEK